MNRRSSVLPPELPAAVRAKALQDTAVQLQDPVPAVTAVTGSVRTLAADLITALGYKDTGIRLKLTDHVFHMGGKTLIIAAAGEKLYAQQVMRP